MLVHKELPVFDKLAVMDLEGTIHHNRLGELLYDYRPFGQEANRDHL